MSRVQGSGSRGVGVQVSGFRGSGFRVQGLGVPLSNELGVNKPVEAKFKLWCDPILVQKAF